MGFKYDDVHADYYNLKVLKINPDVMPAQRSRLFEITGKHGAYDFGMDFGPRKIEINCYLKSTPEELREKLREISAWLSPLDRSKDLILDGDGLVYAGRVESLSTKEYRVGLGLVFLTLSFVCPSPFGRAAALTSVNFSGDVASISRQGSAPTPCIISVDLISAETFLKFSHSNGKFIKINYSFALGNHLEIDTDRRTIKINGLNSLSALDVKSSFFELNKGGESITVTPAGKITGNVQYYERWI